jgi:hypothetical protein
MNKKKLICAKKILENHCGKPVHDGCAPPAQVKCHQWLCLSALSACPRNLLVSWAILCHFCWIYWYATPQHKHLQAQTHFSGSKHENSRWLNTRVKYLRLPMPSSDFLGSEDPVHLSCGMLEIMTI